MRPPKQRKLVRRIIVHERYSDLLTDHNNDVAVVELASPIEFTSDVHSVCLPEASHVFPDNASCFVTGWGALENDGECLLPPCALSHMYLRRLMLVLWGFLFILSSLDLVFNRCMSQ